MSNLKIITNHRWREFISGFELTEKEKKEFDYMSKEEIEEGTFFRYRNWIYTLGDFMRIDKGMFEDFADWNGYASDSFFSGVLIKISDDGDQYQIATYIS